MMFRRCGVILKLSDTAASTSCHCPPLSLRAFFLLFGEREGSLRSQTSVAHTTLDSITLRMLPSILAKLKVARLWVCKREMLVETEG